MDFDLFQAAKQKSAHAKITLEIGRQMLNMAQEFDNETALTQVLVDALISKAKVFPDDNVEIAWTMPEFFGG